MALVNGVGHNRTNDLALTIRERVAAYNDALVIAEQATQKAQLEALSAVFEFDHWFGEYPDERDRFYDEHGIKVDPRVRHQSQPLVKHFLVSGEFSKSMRNKATLWAGAISEAHRQGVKPDGFVQFIKDTPEGILGAYMASKRAMQNKTARHDVVGRVRIAELEFRQRHDAIDIHGIDNIYNVSAGKQLAVIDVADDGAASLIGMLDRNPKAVEQTFQDHLLEWHDNDCQTPKRAKPTSRKRYEASETRVAPIILKPDHPAAVEARTQHPHLVQMPSNDEWVLKSGEHSRKLGSVITKGKWSGFPVYGLTLEERATCPSSCEQWLNCYGNGMSQMRAYRYQRGPELLEALDRELTILSSEPNTRNGFAVRLHSLGDFYDTDYVEFWKDKLIQHPSLRVFGFTAWHPTNDDIGRAIKRITDKHWNRFAIRFSNQPNQTRSASVVPNDTHRPQKGDGIICPAEEQMTNSCSTCGYCWNSEKPIVFIEH